VHQRNPALAAGRTRAQVRRLLRQPVLAWRSRWLLSCICLFLITLSCVSFRHFMAAVFYIWHLPSGKIPSSCCLRTAAAAWRTCAAHRCFTYCRAARCARAAAWRSPSRGRTDARGGRREQRRASVAARWRGDKAWWKAWASKPCYARLLRCLPLDFSLFSADTGCQKQDSAKQRFRRGGYRHALRVIFYERL